MLTTLPRPVSATFFFNSSTLQLLFGLIVNVASFLSKSILTELDSTHRRDCRASATALVQPTRQVMPSSEATYFPPLMLAELTVFCLLESAAVIDLVAVDGEVFRPA